MSRIRGGRLIFRFSIFSRVGVSALIAVVVLCDRGCRCYAHETDQKIGLCLKDCRFIPNPANDGDSFHVSAGAKEYLFRLYFVDAPETDAMDPGRLVEQAKYFGITVPQAIEVGQAAKEFVREKLSEPFTVFTHMSDAMGQSRLERFYAFVQTKEGDLGEQLVRNGLARSYGFKAAPPGLQSSRIEVDKTSATRERSETGENRSLGRKRRTIECACTNAIGFQFFCCRWKDSLTLDTCGLACRFFSSCETSRVDYAQQSSRDEWIARKGKDSARKDRHQHCDRKRANNRAGNRARDGGAHYRRATVPKR